MPLPPSPDQRNIMDTLDLIILVIFVAIVVVSARDVFLK